MRRRREGTFDRRGIEPARRGDVGALQQDRARLRRVRERRRRPAHGRVEANVLEPPPRIEVRRGIDGAVVAETEQPDRVHLEMEMVRRALGITCVADEAEHVPRAHDRAVDGER